MPENGPQGRTSGETGDPRNPTPETHWRPFRRQGKDSDLTAGDGRRDRASDRSRTGESVGVSPDLSGKAEAAAPVFRSQRSLGREA